MHSARLLLLSPNYGSHMELVTRFGDAMPSFRTLATLRRSKNTGAIFALLSGWATHARTLPQWLCPASASVKVRPKEHAPGRVEATLKGAPSYFVHAWARNHQHLQRTFMLWRAHSRHAFSLATGAPAPKTSTMLGTSQGPDGPESEAQMYELMRLMDTQPDDEGPEATQPTQDECNGRAGDEARSSSQGLDYEPLQPAAGGAPQQPHAVPAQLMPLQAPQLQPQHHTRAEETSTEPLDSELQRRMQPSAPSAATAMPESAGDELDDPEIARIMQEDRFDDEEPDRSPTRATTTGALQSEMQTDHELVLMMQRQREDTGMDAPDFDPMDAMEDYTEVQQQQQQEMMESLYHEDAPEADAAAAAKPRQPAKRDVPLPPDTAHHADGPDAKKFKAGGTDALLQELFADEDEEDTGSRGPQQRFCAPQLLATSVPGEWCSVTCVSSGMRVYCEKKTPAQMAAAAADDALLIVSRQLLSRPIAQLMREVDDEKIAEVGTTRCFYQTLGCGLYHFLAPVGTPCILR